ncbi:MAG: helix-turn-helix domain-containing protein [Actinomycetota bacterium]|nr:helix-turn-helix domain-containing protein [Actinomycetota bacterium]
MDASESYASVRLDVHRLRDLRRQKGWSQHTLSLRVGVQGAAAVSAWERGLAVPRPATLRRVAEVLGVEPVELLAVDNAEGLALRELRVSRGMSLKELAEAANASSSTVRRWESGDFKRLPARDVVRALARALNVSAARVEMALVLARRMAQSA